MLPWITNRQPSHARKQVELLLLHSLTAEGSSLFFFPACGEVAERSDADGVEHYHAQFIYFHKSRQTTNKPHPPRYARVLPRKRGRKKVTIPQP